MVCMAALAFAVFFVFDSLPDVLVADGVLLSLFPLFVVLVVEVAGLLLVWQMWFQREKLKAKYGNRAYQQVFLFGFGGIVWILTVAINQYIPFYILAPTFWAISPLQILATPLEAFFVAATTFIFIIKELLAIILLATGLLMSARALQVFGLDYMVVLYLYFPKESKVQKNNIYSVLRHPTYTGAILICLGGTLFTFTPLSFAVFAVFLIGFYIHVYFVEEKELIERFGESYRGYRKKVPAFFVKPKDVRALLSFLAGNDN